MNFKRKQIILLSGIMTALVIFTGCKKERVNEKAVITFVLGDVTIQNKTGPHPAEVRAVLNDGDIITTGEKSYMVVQMGAKLMFRVEAKSKLEISSLIKYGQDELNLTQGLILSKISRLEKNEKYIVKTPTALASVRGTVFSTAYYNDVTNVAVAEGKVNVTNISSSIEKPTDAEMAAVTAGTDVDVRQISSVEKLTLQKIAEAERVDNMDTVSNAELEDTGTKIQENDQRIDKQIDDLLKPEPEKKLTLNDIRVKYGRIDIVKLYSGKIYRGAILSRGNKIKMLTPQGDIEIDTKKIKQTESR
jgi:hypothetical protein